MLVDYHFHPNLSKWDFWAKRKCAKIWRKFSDTKLDVVVITEHVFKHSERAYQLLAETRPANATTVIFPGMEALTSEGIDVIVYSEDEYIYSLRELVVPKQLSLQAMAEFVANDSALMGSVAHPANFGHSGSERRIGKEPTVKAIRTIGGAEIANSCFKGQLYFAKHLHLERLLKNAIQRASMVETLPADYYDFPEVVRFTGGSDAHVLSEIGSGMVVAEPVNKSRTAIFEAISNTRSTEFHESKYLIKPFHAYYKAYSVFVESSIKALRLYEGRLYQNDDDFTNYYSEAEKETVLAWRQRLVLWLKPILNVLTYFEVTPNILSGLSFLLIIASVGLLAFSEPWATALFIAYLVTNTLTQPLTKYQKIESEVSALTQIILYEFALIAAVFAAMGLDWAGNWISSLYLMLYTVMLWLTITLNKEGQPVQLVIRSKNIVLLAMFIKMTTGYNWIEPVLWVFSGYMALLDGYMLRRLLQTAAMKERLAKRNFHLRKKT